MPRNSTTYKIAGPKTFRLGSTQILDLWGSNLQNVNKDIRRIYIPDKNKVFLQADQSGAEALIVAYLTRAGKLRSLFDHKIKPHTYLGLMFPEQWRKEFPRIDKLTIDIPLDELKQNEDWKILSKKIADSDNNPPATRFYYHYKQTCHSSNYGVTENAFRLNVLDKSGGKVALSYQQAQIYLTGYHNAFPEIREWHREVEVELLETHTLHNLFGHPYYFNLVNERMLKEAYAVVPQGTVGVITHIAFTNLQNYIEDLKLDWDIMQNNHDSYLVQCPFEEKNHCGQKMQEYLNQDLVSPRGEKFQMRSEIQYGWNWGPQSDKNPEGLRPLDLAA